MQQMKTIFDKWPLRIEAGKTITLELPQPFLIDDSLFLLVHNSLNSSLKLSLEAENGAELSQVFSLHSFPSILVFGEGSSALAEGYTRVAITSFDDFEGKMTYRVKNPAAIMAAHR